MARFEWARSPREGCRSCPVFFVSPRLDRCRSRRRGDPDFHSGAVAAVGVESATDAPVASASRTSPRPRPAVLTVAPLRVSRTVPVPLAVFSARLVLARMVRTGTGVTVDRRGRLRRRCGCRGGRCGSWCSCVGCRCWCGCRWLGGTSRRCQGRGIECLLAEEFAACQPDQEHQGPDSRRLVDGYAVTGRPHGTAHGCRSPHHSPAETPRSEAPHVHEYRHAVLAMADAKRSPGGPGCRGTVARGRLTRTVDGSDALRGLSAW